MKYKNYAPNRKFIMPKPISIVRGAPYYNLADMVPTDTSGFCIVTIGNSGTAMTMKALAYLSGEPVHASHSMYHEHSKFLMLQTGIKVILVVRDPRDYLLSRMGIRDADIDMNAINGVVPIWAKASAFQSQAAHAMFAPIYAKMSILEKIKLQLTENIPPPFGNTFALYETLTPFLSRPNTMVVKFEDLINPDARIESLIDMGNFLELPLNDEIVQIAADNLIGGTVNFNPNEDKIGYWKKHFTQELNDMFEAGPLKNMLGVFGYDDVSLLPKPKLT
jgi:hypothetical protein